MFCSKTLAQMFLSPVKVQDKLICKGSQVFLHGALAGSVELWCLALCLGSLRFNVSSFHSEERLEVASISSEMKADSSWACSFSSPILPTLKIRSRVYFDCRYILKIFEQYIRSGGFFYFFSQQGLSCYKSITWIVMGCEEEGDSFLLKILCFLTIYLMYFLMFACVMC